MYYLPKIFCPKYKSKLVRIGDVYDGGYCISKRSIQKSDILLSFGVGDNWSFEKHFKKKNNLKVICYDNSIGLLFWVKRLIKNILYFKFKENYILQVLNFFKFFNFIIFFNNKNNILIKKHIIKNLNKKTDKKSYEKIDIIFKKIKGKKIFLKIDIEGSEYNILKDIIRFQKNLVGLVIEFHNCYNNKRKIIEFIKSFNLDLVHIHINNFCDTEKGDFPTVFELTFSPRIFNKKRKKKDINFPDKNIDNPNNQYLEDGKLFFI